MLAGESWLAEQAALRAANARAAAGLARRRMCVPAPFGGALTRTFPELTRVFVSFPKILFPCT